MESFWMKSQQMYTVYKETIRLSSQNYSRNPNRVNLVKDLTEGIKILCRMGIGGAEGIWTPDLQSAILALSQLSYCPVI